MTLTSEVERIGISGLECNGSVENQNGFRMTIAVAMLRGDPNQAVGLLFLI
ncbi:MAG: hypothetical protein ACK58L_09265 [Planctomycetota bacterium]